MEAMRAAFYKVYDALLLNSDPRLVFCQSSSQGVRSAAAARKTPRVVILGVQY
jgi:hypothetical protein